MPKKKAKAYDVMAAQIGEIKLTLECDALIEALYERKRDLARTDYAAIDKAASKLKNNKWREYQATLVKGPTGRMFCPYCDRHVTIKKFNRFYLFSAQTPALHNGQDIVVRACCLQCHQELVQRYKKECEWLQQQQTELRHMKTMATITSQEVSKLLKRASRREKSLPAS